jgi:hypothetical protein
MIVFGYQPPSTLGAIPNKFSSIRMLFLFFLVNANNPSRVTYLAYISRRIT